MKKTKRTLLSLVILLAWLVPVSSSFGKSHPLASCTNQNILQGHTAQLIGEGNGLLPNLTDGETYEDGALWNLPQTVIIGRNSFLLFDLGQENKVASAWIQADNNDVYTVEGSLDGKSFNPVTFFGPAAVMGLQTRWMTGLNARARYIKIVPSGGDGYYSASEVGLYCDTPSPFPPQTKIIATPKQTPWGREINDYRVTVYKVLIVLAALVLVSIRHYRQRLVLLGVVALLSYASYYNFFHWHFDSPIHTWEVYHYYMGSKYFPELGYARLYECTSLADSEEGFLDQVKNRKIRDHRVNVIRPATYILENPNLCKERFTAKRWEDFKSDLKWFRNNMSPDRWDNMQQDHGYNPPPVWTTLGRIVDSFYTTTHEDILALAQLDIIIVLIAFAFIFWAFGWEGLLLSVIIWGTNYPSRYYWIGGAYLRHSWFVSAMIGLAFLKKQKPWPASFFLALATSITIFPLMFFAGPTFKIIQEWWSQKKLSPFNRRFVMGTVISGIFLLTASLLGTGGGLEAYKDFTHTMQVHMSTPLTNDMGFKTLVGYRPSTKAERMYNAHRLDPFEIWKIERRKAFNASRIFYALAIVGFFGLFWRAVKSSEMWEAAALGFTLIIMLNELTCYYYSFMVAGALIGSKRPRLGLGLLIANLAWLICEFYWNWFDVKYTYASLVGVLISLYFVIEMGRRPLPESR